MKIRSTIISLFIIFLFSNTVSAQTEQGDTLRVYWHDPVEVIAKRYYWGESEFPTNRNNFTRVLNNSGFALIRKGAFFAQDLYSDGLKRNDIVVVIDGERYHSACPNRMDSPLTRANPLEMATINMRKTSSAANSGFGGILEFQREKPSPDLKLKAGFSASADASESSDGAFSANYNNYQLSGRYTSGSYYEDADGRTFKDLYNYESDNSFQLAELALSGRQKNLGYRSSFTYTDEVLFPYLMMDERVNRIYSGHLSYKSNKLYFNYTDHTMDNDLRVSSMFMETAARNLTVGLNGDFYDAYYRNWDADNIFITPMTTINNHLMPDVSQLYLAAHKLYKYSDFTVSGKAGISYHRMGDKTRLDFFRQYYSDPRRDKFSSSIGVGIGYSKLVNTRLSMGILSEMVTEPPETENLYISVQKPMGKPAWVGNQNLSNPKRATLRGTINYSNIRLELFGSHIYDYISLYRQMANSTPYMTYKNIDAIIIGFNINWQWSYLDINTSYTRGDNRSNGYPLAEILPLQISGTLRSPEFNGFRGTLKYRYSDAQTRIDPTLDETSTPSWHKIDLGLSYVLDNLHFSLDLENITNELYYQHLSYLRSPFSSGAKVFEPGRTIRFNISFNKDYTDR